jgi:hypothetical protein
MNLLKAHESWYFSPKEFEQHIEQAQSKNNKGSLNGVAITSRTNEVDNGFEFTMDMYSVFGYNMQIAKKNKAYHWIDYNKPTNLYFGITKTIIEFLQQKNLHPTRCRLSVIPAGKKIPFHNDSVSPRQYSMKLHIPIVTDNNVITTMNGIDYFMEPGKVYLFNANSWHGITNNSDKNRWHFLCDVYDTEGHFSFGKCNNYDYHLNIAKLWRDIIDNDLSQQRIYIDA